jgi:hypothetical protein
MSVPSNANIGKEVFLNQAQTTRQIKVASGGKIIVLSIGLFIFFTMLQMRGPIGMLIGVLGSLVAIGIFLFGLFRYLSGKMSKR